MHPVDRRVRVVRSLPSQIRGVAGGRALLTFAVDMDARVGRWGRWEHVGEEGGSDWMRTNDRTDFASL